MVCPYRGFRRGVNCALDMTPPSLAGPIVADRSAAADRLEVRGADRARFLNGLVTVAVKELGEGDGTLGFFTARKGGVLADCSLVALADSFWLELPPGRGEAIRAHLEQYVLADRVEIAALDLAPVAVLGSTAEGALAALVGELPAKPWSHRVAVLGDRTVRVQNRPGLGAPAWQAWVPAAAAPALAGELIAATGGRPPAEGELEALRVLAGQPRWGVDYGEDTLPQETGLESAIHYSKGCYLGQEIVARVHYRGGVQRGLVGLVLAGPAKTGAELSFEGRPVGSLGTVVDTPGRGSIALAIVHRRGGAPGTLLILPDGAPAQVVPLPFDPLDTSSSQEGI